jgi:PAS domain S-box-containing protein
MVVKIASERLLRKQIKELGEDTDFLSTLLENIMGHAIMATDLDGNVIAYNEGARKTYGYTPEEIIGKQNMEIFFPGESVADGKLQRIIGNLRKTGKFSCEEDMLRKNGERFPARILFVLTRDKAGEPDGFIEMAEDLTERKRLENRWWHSMSNFYKVVNNSADGILITSGEGIVRFVNPAAELLFGRRKEEFQGEHFGFPITSGDTTEIEIIRKTGETVTAEMRVVETNWFDEIAYLATLRDITERKRAQQAQERLSRQLKEKVEELEAFSYAVAHDLRSPLVSIQGFVQMLQADLQNRKTESVLEDIHRIESGVGKMRQLIKASLDYSRAGQLVKPVEDIPFGEIVADIITEFGSQVRSIGAGISLADKFPMVYADRLRIREVLANLLQNSINYRNKNRPLEIEIGCDSSKDKAVFFIRDNGVGIEPGEAEKVFELFYRGTVDGGGIGAGLAIAKRIIEAHGGSIWMEGQPGTGTTVYFTLPQHRSREEGNTDGKD